MTEAVAFVQPILISHQDLERLLLCLLLSWWSSFLELSLSLLRSLCFLRSRESSSLSSLLLDRFVSLFLAFLSEDEEELEDPDADDDDEEEELLLREELLRPRPGELAFSLFIWIELFWVSLWRRGGSDFLESSLCFSTASESLIA